MMQGSEKTTWLYFYTQTSLVLLKDKSEQIPDIKKRNRDLLSDDTYRYRYKANRNCVFIRKNPKEYCPIAEEDEDAD